MKINDPVIPHQLQGPLREAASWTALAAWAREEEKDIVGWHLREVTAPGAELSRLTFRGVRLERCRFSEADAERTAFLDTEFVGCDLSGANFDAAFFSEMPVYRLQGGGDAPAREPPDPCFLGGRRLALRGTGYVSWQGGAPAALRLQRLQPQRAARHGLGAGGDGADRGQFLPHPVEGCGPDPLPPGRDPHCGRGTERELSSRRIRRRSWPACWAWLSGRNRGKPYSGVPSGGFLRGLHGFQGFPQGVQRIAALFILTAK